jgi:hypothetical protein
LVTNPFLASFGRLAMTPFVEAKVHVHFIIYYLLLILRSGLGSGSRVIEPSDQNILLRSVTERSNLENFLLRSAPKTAPIRSEPLRSVILPISASKFARRIFARPDSLCPLFWLSCSRAPVNPRQTHEGRSGSDRHASASLTLCTLWPRA